MGLPPEIVTGLSRRLAERAGLELPAWVVESRARARIAALGVDAEAYLALVSAARGDAELGELIEAVRVGETRFFRQRAQVDALVERVAPALAARRGPLRVWSAGCASGEEPYTLAIVLARALPEQTVTIVATDVSEDALEVAARGEYPAAALEQVPSAHRDAFVVEGGRARVRPEIARRVTFKRQNLVEGDPPRDCALVWCRNVLIYFAPEARRRAVEHLVGALAPGGYLFVGYSESLRDVPGLVAVRAGEAVVYERRDPDPPAPRKAAPTPPPIAPSPPAPRPARRTAPAVVKISRVDQIAVDLAAALAVPGLERLVVDLDDAEFLPDDAAIPLRRACAAARAAGIAIDVRATSPGAQRWLRRHRVIAEESP